MQTKQIDFWKGEFGKEKSTQTEAHINPFEEWDKEYVEWYGVAKTTLNEQFLGFLNKENVTILKVGSNLGYQLQGLQAIGFKNLYGIELQHYAAEPEISKKRNTTH